MPMWSSCGCLQTTRPPNLKNHLATGILSFKKFSEFFYGKQKTAITGTIFKKIVFLF